MITKKQFDVLNSIIEAKKQLTQREIANSTNLSVGTVNKLVASLTEDGILNNGTITEKGFEVLEKYRVKRIVIIAAGFGSRLVPITLNTPKPLVRVKGKRIIDSLLDAVIAAGIEEIYIVRGYLSEQFDQLLYKYPNIKFIENSAYNEGNNIISVKCAGELIKNAYIAEADLLLSNPSLIKKYQYYSNYLGIPVNKTDDWCFDVKNDVIEKMAIGGIDCYQMVGISYWTEEDGERLVHRVNDVYNAPGGKERYWDQVPLEYYINEFKVYVRECSLDDIVEIDSFAELKLIDKTYNV